MSVGYKFESNKYHEIIEKILANFTFSTTAVKFLAANSFLMFSMKISSFNKLSRTNLSPYDVWRRFALDGAWKHHGLGQFPLVE